MPGKHANKEGIENWGSLVGGDIFDNVGTWYSENKSCPNYMIFVNSHSVAGYHLFAAPTYADAVYIQKNKESLANGVNAYITTSMNSSERDLYEDKINGYTKMLENIGKTFDLQQYCGYKNNKYVAVGDGSTNPFMCKNKMQQVYTTINEADKYVANLIAKKIFTEDSKIMQLYYSARDYARSQFDSSFDEQFIEDPETHINPTPGQSNPTPGQSGSQGTSTEPEYSTSKRTCVSCGNGTLKDIPSQLPLFVRNCVKVFQLMIPVILIILGIIDFVRAVIANDEKVMAEAQKRFIRRIVAGVLIFFVVAIVRFIFGLIDGNVDVLGCVPCFISDSESCGEEYTCPARKSLSTSINSGDESSSTHTSGGGSGNSASGATTSTTTTVSGCSAYASQSECGRPEAQNKGCSWASTSKKCIYAPKGCAAYATRSECSRPSAASLGCTWDANADKCVAGS